MFSSRYREVLLEYDGGCRRSLSRMSACDNPPDIPTLSFGRCGTQADRSGKCRGTRSISRAAHLLRTFLAHAGHREHDDESHTNCHPHWHFLHPPNRAIVNHTQWSPSTLPFATGGFSETCHPSRHTRLFRGRHGDSPAASRIATPYRVVSAP